MQLRIDGLTPQVLRAAPRSWWDEAFTRRLLDFIPKGSRVVVEPDCGLAASAHLLLPSLPEARYLGFGRDPQLLSEARDRLSGLPFASRVELHLGASPGLPLDDGCCDLVLSLMTLLRCPEVSAVLTEAARLLQPGGRLVCCEPDNLGQHFYFDGVLEEICQSFHALCLRARVALQPADIALGPRLSSLIREAGLHGVESAMVAIHSLREETAMAFADRLGRLAQAITEDAQLPSDEPALETCRLAVKRWLFSDLPRRLGFSCHLVPVFISSGRRL